MGADKCVSHDFGPLALAIVAAALIFSAAIYFSPAKASNGRYYELHNSSIASLSDSPRIIYAGAEAAREVEPDKVEITLSVVSNGTDPAAIQSENDARTRRVKSAIISAGVPEAGIQTIGYNLERNYQYDKDLKKYEFAGYKLTNSIHVASYNVSLAGKILKGAVSEGANEVSGISFGLSDSARDAVYGELLKEAVSRANAKADAMASAAGVRIAGLSAMNEGYTIVDVLSSYKDAMAGTALPDALVSAGLVKVKATVSAGYEIEE